MTVLGYLAEYEAINNNEKAIKFVDIFDDGMIYCAGGYEQALEEISSENMQHVASARFVNRFVTESRNCIVIYYLKSNIYSYSQSVLINVCEKLCR